MANHDHRSVKTDAIMDKALFKNLVGGAIAIGLFYIATQAFSQLIDDVVESKYEWVAERFTLSIGHIRKEWVYKGKPSALPFDYHLSLDETVEITVQFNQYGWPVNIDPKSQALNCMSLWMLFAHEEAHRESMLDLTSYLSVEKKPNGCEYHYRKGSQDDLVFSYNIQSGRVDTVELD